MITHSQSQCGKGSSWAPEASPIKDIRPDKNFILFKAKTAFNFLAGISILGFYQYKAAKEMSHN